MTDTAAAAAPAPAPAPAADEQPAPVKVETRGRPPGRMNGRQRRSADGRNLGVRLPEELHARIHAAAAAQRLTMVSFVEQTLERACELAERYSPGPGLRRPRKAARR